MPLFTAHHMLQLLKLWAEMPGGLLLLPPLRAPRTVKALICFAFLKSHLRLIFFLKEIFMGLGAIKLLQKNIVVQSKWFGKLSTNFFFLAIVASMLSPFIKVLGNYIIPLFILALLSLVFAFVMYLVNFIKVEKKIVAK